MELQGRYRQVRDNIAAAARKSRRDPREITLVAVTKNAPDDQVKALLEMGQVHFAESKVQQLQTRVETFNAMDRGGAPPGGAPPIWHMVGHLQRNKVKPATQLAQYIHSVDSLRLSEEIQMLADRMEKVVQIMMEVNTSGEARKFGVAVGAAQHLAEQIDTMESVHLVGLMTMAPKTRDVETQRRCFIRLREIFEEIRFRKIGGNHFVHLSMGMSQDYAVAVEEGATMVRVGTALFGEGPE